MARRSEPTPPESVELIEPTDLAPAAPPEDSLGESPLDASPVSDSDPSEEDSSGAEPGPGEQLSDEELAAAVSALVFAAPEPISVRRLAEVLERPARTRVAAVLDGLRAKLEASGLPWELREIAGGFQVLTKPEMGEIVQRLFKARRTERISAAALETLAVIAYRQPVSKAEIEAIRGVQAGPILRSLIERGLVRVTGRADVPGHPLQYGTTREFLDRFGLANLAELPRDSELTKD